VSEHDESVVVQLGDYTRRQLRGGGDDGHDGGMSDLEKRVAAVELKLATIDTKVDRLVNDARETQIDMKSIIKTANDTAGKVSQLPSTFVMATWFVGVSIGLVGLVFAIAFTIARTVK